MGSSRARAGRPPTRKVRAARSQARSVSWLPSWSRDPRGLLALAVCLAIVAALLWLAPQDDPYRQDEKLSAAGEWNTMPDYRTQLVSVRLVEAVTNRYSVSTPAHPGTVLVVVEWKLAALREQALVGKISLRTRGELSYDERSDVCGETFSPVQPGFTRTSVSCFEVPRDRVAGSRMILGPPPRSLVSYTRVAGFDLGLDSGAAVEPGITEPRASVEVTS